MEALGSCEFYLDDIYEDYPNYGDGSNTLIDSYYNMPDEFLEKYDSDQYYKLIGATFMLDTNNGANKNISTKETFKRRALETVGNPVGRARENPLPDTREYEVELEYGTADIYFATVVAENLWVMCNIEGKK